MLHGEISNRVKATFGFFFSEFVMKKEENSFKDRLLNLIKGKSLKDSLDIQVIQAMEYIFRQTEYNVDLLMSYKDADKFGDLISDLPYCRVVCYNKVTEISSRLLIGDLTYVVDTPNSKRLGNISAKNILTLDEVWKLIRGVL